MSVIQLLLGNIGVPGGGLNALRGEPNVQGCTDMCIMPADLLGLDRNGWQRLVDIACSFAGEACRSTENYIGREFAQTVAAKFNV